MSCDQESRLRLSPDSTLRAYLELVRAPNLFTSMADVAMGFLFVRATQTPPPPDWLLVPLIAASVLLYASGVALNDLFDVRRDARQRPERPLPSRRISLAAARRLGWMLLLAGAAAGWLCAAAAGHLRPGIVAGLLAVCILLYDAALKRTPLGPLLMGGCRMLNVLLGMSVAAAWHAEHWVVAAGIGIYVAGVTSFARTEAVRSSRLRLALGTTVMMLGIAVLASFPGWGEDLRRPAREYSEHWGLLMVILGAMIGWRCFRAVLDPSAGRVQATVKLCILWLVALDAAVCYAVGGPAWAAMILLLLLPAALLGHWIRLT